ncbi:hypothetical protein TNCT_82801 [Trichonephila clavata]|uniref:Uncharacterized protein n=1 Tax=Trichonephila clavata TaxID=2740835 RepID=A0A8X6J404_TRICU|nr:hypothetical protein TNCT_82801 [Trichonephila clavata]
MFQLFSQLTNDQTFPLYLYLNYQFEHTHNMAPRSNMADSSCPIGSNSDMSGHIEISSREDNLRLLLKYNIIFVYYGLQLAENCRILLPEDEKASLFIQKG